MNRHIILESDWQDPDLTRRLNHNNVNRAILYDDAKPEGIVRAGYDGSPDNAKLEHGLVKFKQIGGLGRQVLREAHAYTSNGKRQLYRYVPTTSHGMNGLEEDEVLNPKNPDTPCSDVKLYKPCDICGCQDGRMCIDLQLQEERIEATWRPIEIFKDGYREIVRQEWIDHLEQKWDYSIPDVDWDEVDLDAWVKTENARYEAVEQARSKQDIHIPTWAVEQAAVRATQFEGTQPDLRVEENAESTYQGGTVEDVLAESHGFNTMSGDAFADSVEKALARASVPRDFGIPLGRMDVQFYDHYPEGHKLSWLLDTIISRVAGNITQFTEAYDFEVRAKHRRKQEAWNDEQKLSLLTAYSKTKKPGDGLSWYTFLLEQDRTSLGWKRPSDMTDEECEALYPAWVRANYTKGGEDDRVDMEVISGEYIRWWDVSPDRENVEIKSDGSRKQTGFYWFLPGEKIPFRSSYSYLCWRLDETTCLRKTGEVNVHGQEMRESVLLREAWPTLYVEAYKFINRAVWDENCLDEECIDMLDAIDGEHAAWYYEQFRQEWEALKEQPLYETAVECIEELEKLVEDGVDINEKTQLVTIRGKQVLMSRISEVSCRLGAMKYSGESIDPTIWEVEHRDKEGGSSIWALRRLVHGTVSHMWDQAKRRLRRGYTLPDGTDLMHASKMKMERSSHLQIFGPKTASLIARAIVKRRSCGFWMFGEEKTGIYYQSDLFNLTLEEYEAQGFWFYDRIVSDEDRAKFPAWDDENIVSGTKVPSGMMEQYWDNEDWPSLDEAGLRFVKTGLLRHETQFFVPDHRGKTGAWRSSLLSLMVAPTPEMDRRWFTAIVQARHRSLEKRSSQLLGSIGMKLHGCQGQLHKQDYDALWSIFKVQMAKLKKSLAKSFTRRR